MGDGTARGGRLPCKQDSQMGSIPISSTILSCKVLDKYITYRYNKSTFIYPYGVIGSISASKADRLGFKSLCGCHIGYYLPDWL